jgi:hypothetical protein
MNFAEWVKGEVRGVLLPHAWAGCRRSSPRGILRRCPCRQRRLPRTLGPALRGRRALPLGTRRRAPSQAWRPGDGGHQPLRRVRLIGIILRLSSGLRCEEYDFFEVSEIAFDEVFAEGTFRLDLPGVQFRRALGR